MNFPVMVQNDLYFKWKCHYQKWHGLVIELVPRGPDFVPACIILPGRRPKIMEMTSISRVLCSFAMDLVSIFSSSGQSFYRQFRFHTSHQNHLLSFYTLTLSRHLWVFHFRLSFTRSIKYDTHFAYMRFELNSLLRKNDDNHTTQYFFHTFG